MDIKIDLIARLIVSIILVFIIGKIIGHLFHTIFANLFGGKKKNNIDLDQLIESKKELLRKGAYGVDAIPSSGEKLSENINNRKFSTKTEEYYTRYFLKTSASKKSSTKTTDDIKRVFALFDSARWGGGKPFQEIQEKILTKTGLSVTTQVISQTVNELLRRDILLSLRDNRLPGYLQILEMIQVKLILEQIIKEIQNNGGQLLNNLITTAQVENQCLKMALEALIMEADKVPEQEILNKLLNHSPVKSPLITMESERLKKSIFNLLSDKEHIKFISWNELQKNIIQKAAFFSTLSPLPPLASKRDIEGAYKIFNVKKGTSLKEIRKIYKRLASIKHPDRLASKNIPQQFSTLAKENFTNLQTAFDLIKKDIGRNKNDKK